MSIINLGNVRGGATASQILAALSTRPSPVLSGELSIADSGKIVYATGDIAIPPSVFIKGNSVVISNTVSSAIQITSTLPIRIAGQTTTGEVQLGAYGVAMLLFDGTEVKISGEGLSSGIAAEAAAFFAAAGITTPSVRTAVEVFIQSLKNASVWSKMIGLYPMIQNTGGGTSVASASYNLKNPAVYRLTYEAGVTAANNGIVSNNSGGADTGLNINTTTPNSLAFGTFVVSGATSDHVAMGAWLTDGAQITPNYAGTGAIFDNFYNGGASRIVGSVADTLGFYVSSRTSSSLHSAYKNGVSLGTTTGAQGTPENTNFWLLKRGVGGTTDNVTLGVSFVSAGLTGAEVIALTNAVTALNTSLGR